MAVQGDSVHGHEYWGSEDEDRGEPGLVIMTGDAPSTCMPSEAAHSMTSSPPEGLPAGGVPGNMQNAAADIIVYDAAGRQPQGRQAAAGALPHVAHVTRPMNAVGASILPSADLSTGGAAQHHQCSAVDLAAITAELASLVVTGVGLSVGLEASFQRQLHAWWWSVCAPLSR